MRDAGTTAFNACLKSCVCCHVLSTQHLLLMMRPAPFCSSSLVTPLGHVVLLLLQLGQLLLDATVQSLVHICSVWEHEASEMAQGIFCRLTCPQWPGSLLPEHSRRQNALQKVERYINESLYGSKCESAQQQQRTRFTGFPPGPDALHEMCSFLVNVSLKRLDIVYRHVFCSCSQCMAIV
jgi:hypothetical protein